MNTIPDVLDLTRKLVGMDTINPPGNEHACCVYLAEILEGAGFSIELSEFADGRSNLIATLGNQAEEAFPICLTGHVDTVPLGREPWGYDPFGSDIVDGRIYGRGTTDMKGAVASIAVAAMHLAEQLKETPGVVLVFTGGEETGCDGAKALCDTPDLLGKAGAIVVGEPTSNEPLIGHKGALWLNATSKGVTAHGSTPELGVNAVYAACRAVGKIEEFGFNVSPHDVIGSPSINVGRILGGINVNSVPDHAEFDIDIRTIPNQDHGQLIDHLESYLENLVDLNPSVDVQGVISEASDPWISEVFNILEELQGERPEIQTAKYFTDASVLKPVYGNPPTIILGPGDAAVAHKTDEYCEIDKLRQSVEIYEMIIREWCKV